MTATDLPLQPSEEAVKESAHPSALARIAKYTIVRAAVLALTVVVAVWVTIFIANLGGYVDVIIESRIDQMLMSMAMGGWLRDVPTEEKFEIIDQTKAAMMDAEGLNEPFLLRTVRWLEDGLTLNWGESRYAQTRSWGRSTSEVKDLIKESLPRTLIVFGAANVLLFFVSLFLSLGLARRRGGWLDRLVVTLSPMGAVPAWAFGIVLNVIFLRLQVGLTSGGTFDAWPREFTFAYIPIVLKHMFLPFLSIFVSGFFFSLYTWRSLFLVYSQEDYVDMAKAKGLSHRMLERRYILRPGLPAVLTSFALMLVVLWQQVIALEKFFNVSGIGMLFYGAIRTIDMPLMLGLVVSFAYLLAITMFVLDIFYAVVDPRVRITSEGKTLRAAAVGRRQALVQRFRLGFGRSKRRERIAERAWGREEPRTYTVSERVRSLGIGMSRWLGDSARNLGRALKEVAQYPSAVIGLAIIIAMICTSIATVILIPYDEAVGVWRSEHNIWYRNPLKASPEWVNLFRVNDLPETIVLDSRSVSGEVAQGGDAAASKGATVTKTSEQVTEGMREIVLTYTFDYPYKGFPQDLRLYVTAQYERKRPHLLLTWLTPDGREIEMGSFAIEQSEVYILSRDERLQRELDGERPQEALFADPEDPEVALKGTYQLQASLLVFEEQADADCEFILYGQVYGLAGTDHERRDLLVALLWGMPVALAFGLLAAVGTSVSTVIIAGVGVWYGGWLDSLVQRITEVNLVLPFLPVSIMIYTVYSKSFWAILGVTVALSIFGSGIKNYRAIFLQLKEAPYIEGAQAYGAKNRRIIFRYLIPRIGAVMIPQLVILIPSYVFLEATLAFLEVSDPILPTWGKLIVDALQYGTHTGDIHLLLIPAGLLMMMGVAFAMVGLSLERVLDPRLRER
ncbi:MAG: ABC transporter permease subunit [Anaerolineae bacterium]|jgi:peptide/nickel transport system permease protein